MDAWRRAFETADLWSGSVSRLELMHARQRVRELEKELRREDRALAETAALLTLSKQVQALWSMDREVCWPPRWNREHSIGLLRPWSRGRASARLVRYWGGVSARVLRRWRRAATLVDQRKGLRRFALRRRRRQSSSASWTPVTSPEYRDLPPSQIVPRLADAGLYLASEASFYRALWARNQAHYRGHAQPASKVAKPRALEAVEPNRVWTWDIGVPREAA